MAKGKVHTLTIDEGSLSDNFSPNQAVGVLSTLQNFDFETGDTTFDAVASPGRIQVAQAEKGTNFAPGKNDDNSIVLFDVDGIDSPGTAGIEGIVFGANVDTEREVKALVKGFEPEIANTIVNVWNEFDKGNATTVAVTDDQLDDGNGASA